MQKERPSKNKLFFSTGSDLYLDHNIITQFLSLLGQIIHEASQSNNGGIDGNNAFLISCLQEETPSELPFRISASSLVFVAFSLIKVTQRQLPGSFSHTTVPKPVSRILFWK